MREKRSTVLNRTRRERSIERSPSTRIHISAAELGVGGRIISLIQTCGTDIFWKANRAHVDVATSVFVGFRGLNGGIVQSQRSKSSDIIRIIDATTADLCKVRWVLGTLPF